MNVEDCCCCPKEGLQVSISCKYACCNSSLDTPDGFERQQTCSPEDAVSSDWKCCCLLFSRSSPSPGKETIQKPEAERSAGIFGE